MGKKIGSREELNRLRDQSRAEVDLRTGAKDVCITVHMGTCGIAAGAREVLTSLAEQLELADVSNVTLRQSGCLGLCAQEPMCTLTDKAGRQFRYGKLDGEKTRRIVREHVVGGDPVMDCLVAEQRAGEW